MPRFLSLARSLRALTFLSFLLFPAFAAADYCAKVNVIASDTSYGHARFQAAAFYKAACECQKGVPQQGVDMLQNTMEVTRRNYNDTKPEGKPSLPASVSCNVVELPAGGVASGPTPTLSETLIEDMAEGLPIVEKARGLARQFEQRLAQNSQLTATSDPEQLLREFNARLQNVETLSQSLTEEQTRLGLTAIEGLQSATEGSQAGLYRSVGALGGLYELSESRRQAKSARANLYRQRHQQMSQIFWDASDRVDEQISDFLRRAAYAEHQTDEAYYLALVRHLECHKASMLKNWRSDSTTWLQNTCPVPDRPAAAIPNNLMARHQIDLRTAERKYQHFLDAGGPVYGIGADIVMTSVNGVPLVLAQNVVEGGPAYQAGLRDGYRVTGGSGLVFTEEEARVLFQDSLAVAADPEVTLQWMIRHQQGFGLTDKPRVAMFRQALKRDADGMLLSFINDQFELFMNQQVATEIVGESGRAFLDAAISYAARAVTASPTADHYYQLARYTAEDNALIALSNLLAAEQLSPGYLDRPERRSFFQTQKNNTEDAIRRAIRQANQNYLNGFLQAGLATQVLVDGKDVLTTAVALDQPDSVQLILNHQVNGLSAAARQSLIEKTMLMAAKEDSATALSRLLDLGLPADFNHDGMTLQSVAVASGSSRVQALLASQ